MADSKLIPGTHTGRHAERQPVQLRHLADTPEIIPLLAKWHHQQWGHLVGARTLDQRKARLKHHLQRDAIPTTVTAWVDDQPIGSASLVANDMPELAEWIPWLANVFVHEDYRRQGIGAMLIQRVAAEAAHLGYPRLYLYTLDQMHLYSTLGWQTSHVRFHRGYDMTVMIRDLIVNPPPARDIPIVEASPVPEHKSRQPKTM